MLSSLFVCVCVCVCVFVSVFVCVCACVCDALFELVCDPEDLSDAAV